MIEYVLAIGVTLLFTALGLLFGVATSVSLTKWESTTIWGGIILSVLFFLTAYGFARFAGL